MHHFMLKDNHEDKREMEMLGHYWQRAARRSRLWAGGAAELGEGWGRRKGR